MPSSPKLSIPSRVGASKPASDILDSAMRMNGFSDLLSGVAGSIAGVGSAQTMSTPQTMLLSNSYTPLSLNRIALSYAYMTHGLVQTLVTQPVIDALKGGIRIDTPELDEEERAELAYEISRSRCGDEDAEQERKLRATADTGWASAGDTEGSDLSAVRETRYWARLFGGGGLIVNTAQPFGRKLDISKITKDTPLEFIPADRWELLLNVVNIWDRSNDVPFNYYGLPIHRSRVVKALGTKADAFVRVRLQGWGMSALESAIRPINAFLKFETAVFELIDEAKLDVYKIQGFNASLLDPMGTAMTTQRLQLANQLKNNLNSLAMDAEDGYERKQMTFAGLADLWDQCRLNLCSALKIPMTKLFGMSASGFGSGADSMENYNALCSAEREDLEPLLRRVINLRCQQLFGFIPKYKVVWAPLQTLDGEQAEMVKTAKQNRIMQLKQEGMINGQEASILLRMDELLPIETDVSKGLVEATPQATGGSMIGNEGQLTRDKKAEKREDKPRNDKKAGGPIKVKKS